MTEEQLKAKGWTLAQRGDGLHAVWDSTGNQVGVGDSPDTAVRAAIAASTPSVGAFDEDEE